MPQNRIVSIVDDDESLRAAVEDLVSSAGFNAYAFGSAEDFLRSPHCSETSCLITDVQMPGMSGPDLLRYLLAQGRELPTIFITAFPAKSIRDQFGACGALVVLQKPFDGGALIGFVQDALAQPNKN